MNHISHRWVTETRCACCGAQSGTVIGSGVCARFEQDPKPEPLPHEWVPLNSFSAQCRCCAIVRSNEAIRLAKYSDPCPARDQSPDAGKMTEKPGALPHEPGDTGRACKHCYCKWPDEYEDEFFREPCSVRNKTEAQKAEALPVNVAAVYWLSDAICRSAAYSPATVQKAIYNLIEHILAEVDKRFDRRDDAIGDRVAGLLLSNADAMGLIARDEISKAVAHAFNANVDDFVPRPDLYRIVPGKEGE